MSYSISWYIPKQVIYLKLADQPTVEELKASNREISAILDEGHGKMNILIDAMDLQASYQTSSHLRDTQKFMDHPRMECAVVVTDNKLNRLITLIAFCMARAQFMQFDEFSRAEEYLKHRLATHV